MKKRVEMVIIAVILFGLLLRVYQLGEISCGIDELITVFNSLLFISGHYLGSLAAYWFSVGHFPTYFLMMHYWIKLFGMGEFALRLPSAIFGVFSIYLVFLLGKRLFDRKTSLLASYLFAASTASIFYSQYARPYSMVVCFVLLSFLSFLRALERNTLYSWAGYAAITLFTLLLSASALPILICQALFLAIAWPHYRGRVSLKRASVAFSLITVTYLPFLLKVFLPNIENGKVRPLSWLPLPSLGTLVNIFDIFGGKLIIDDVAYVPDSGLSLLKGIFGVVLFLLCLLGIFSAFKAGKRGVSVQPAPTAVFPLSGVFLSLWLIIPLALPAVFSYLFSPVFGEVRYVLYLSVPYYLLISRGIMHFGKKTRILVFICIILAGLLFLREYYRVEKRTNWRQISSYIKNNIKSDEKTAFMPYRNMQEYLILSYYKVPSLIALVAEGELERPAVMEQIYNNPVKIYKVEELDSKGLWLLAYTPPGLERLHAAVIKKLQDKYGSMDIAAAKRFDFIAITLYHFRSRK